MSAARLARGLRRSLGTRVGAGRDRGAVTVEAALGIGAVVAVFLLVLSAMGVLLSQLRCTDAAVEAARLAARGDHDGARTAVNGLAPAGAELVLTVEDGLAIAEVTAPPGAGLLPEHWRSSRAAAALEPEAPEPEPPAPEVPVSGAPAPEDDDPGSDDPGSGGSGPGSGVPGGAAAEP
ncbi:TadE family type IV pilus minor pilin [Saccharopolyspora sp. MS10]|uniref:TadE family type IV pilus minor pilin n=1 Tax=Saccharopolyspora sp. MS10 TaxID=3385973 RepID=UPI0039A35C52